MGSRHEALRGDRGSGIPGAHTQGATLDELHENLREVLELCLEEYDGSFDDMPRFVGLQQIEVTA